MLTSIALLSLAVSSTPVPVVRQPHFYRPRIELWTNRGDGAVYTRGESVQLYFRLDQDAYVTIFRVDTDGRVRVLFPREPWEDNFARGGREFQVDGNQLGRDAFAIDDYAGVGYLFAVAAPDPFTYDQIESGDHWDYRVIADGRVRGDPYVALTELAQRIVPEGYADWDYDIVSYNVEQHYDYPRFLCYDCHSYVSYPYWDPYYYSCVRFRMYVYDDPWYYPYRYYGGGRVVFVRPYRPQPRFIFKDWGADRPTREGFVTRERERPVSDRPVNDNTRRGVTGRDLGGLGIIPPPNVRDRRGQTGTDGGNIRVDTRGGRGRTDDAGTTNDRPTDDRGGRRGNEGTGNVTDRPTNDGGGRRGSEGATERPMVLPPRERQQEQQAKEPRRVEPRNEPRREEPRRVEPRNEPRREEPRRVEPRNEPRSQPRAEPRNEPRHEPRSQPRAEPRNEPRSQPRAEPAREKPRNEPEVRRRKP
ncbi:MAG: DUF4384 domain-containing protein [Gemmatimonadota bacterium]